MKNIQKVMLNIIGLAHITLINANTLFEKAKEGKINSVKHLVMIKKQDVNQQTEYETPLLVAVKNYQEQVKSTKEHAEQDPIDYDQVIIFLLSQGASMAQEGKDGRTVFHYAVASESPHLLKLLLDNINTQSARAFNVADPHGITPLHLAAQLANLEMVTLLGDAGAKVDLQTRIEAKKPIDVVGEFNKYASAPTKVSIKQYLSYREANPVKPQPVKRLSLMPSHAHEKQTAAERKFRAAADIKTCAATAAQLQPKDLERNVQLMHAIADGNAKPIKELVKQGAEVTFKGLDNITPLMQAIIFYEPKSGHKEIIDYLLAQGASLLDKDAEGKTALHYAVNKEDTYLVKELLTFTKAQPNPHQIINAVDNNGNTSLHYAAMTTNVPIANLLLINGASINVQNKEHKIPVDVIDTKRSAIYTTRTNTKLAADTIELKELLGKHGVAAAKQKPSRSKHNHTASQPPAGAIGIANSTDANKADVNAWENLPPLSRTRSHSVLHPPNQSLQIMAPNKNED